MIVTKRQLSGALHQVAQATSSKLSLVQEAFAKGFGARNWDAFAPLLKEPVQCTASAQSEPNKKASVPEFPAIEPETFAALVVQDRQRIHDRGTLHHYATAAALKDLHQSWTDAGGFEPHKLLADIDDVITLLRAHKQRVEQRLTAKVIRDDSGEKDSIPAQLVTCSGERVVSVKNVRVSANYDGDPYGDTVPFTVGSNQFLRTDPDEFTPERDDS